MFARNLLFSGRRFFPLLNFYSNVIKTFTGKTETGYKFKTPDLKMRNIKPISPPGLNIEIPSRYFNYFRGLESRKILYPNRRRLW